MPDTRRTVLAALLAAPAAPMAARAQESFPNRPVTLVVPFPPGGGTDVLGRVLAQHMGEAWRQTVIVENRGGAAGRIGAATVQRAPPDGHTLLVASTGTLMALASGALAGSAPPGLFAVRSVLAPITLIAAPAYVVTVHPEVRARTVADLVALARARPGSIAFGSSGIGAASHLAGELFASTAGIEMLHVPYRGSGPAMADLQAGRIQVMFSPPQTVAGAVANGTLRNLAVTSETRTTLAPDLPTVAESGLPGYSAVGWFGLFGPRDLPSSLAARLSADAARALLLPEARDRLVSVGAEPEPMPPDAFAAYVDADIGKWQRLVRERGITLE